MFEYFLCLENYFAKNVCNVLLPQYSAYCYKEFYFEWFFLYLFFNIGTRTAYIIFYYIDTRHRYLLPTTDCKIDNIYIVRCRYFINIVQLYTYIFFTFEGT